MQKRDDLDLEHFRNLLLQERERLLRELEGVSEETQELADAAENAGDRADAATLDTENTIDQTQIERLRRELKDVEDALKKIEEGSYGICEKTGKPIPVERLEAYPAARTVVGA